MEIFDNTVTHLQEAAEATGWGPERAGYYGVLAAGVPIVAINLKVPAGAGADTAPCTRNRIFNRTDVCGPCLFGRDGLQLLTNRK